MSGSGAGFHTGRMWVVRVVNRAREHLPGGPILVATYTLGALPVALTALYLALTLPETTARFATSQVLAALVAVIAPGGIWYWDRRVFPRFVEETTDIVDDPAALRAVARRYYRSFSDRYWTFTLPWTGLVLAVVALNVGYFRTVGVAGYGDPAFWVYLTFAAWWGLLTGIGFHGAITAVRCIHAVGRLDFEIEPLHPDGLGGLSAVGYFAIWTTMLISVGSLTLPLAFLLGAEGGYRSLVFLAVGIYVGTIALSFVYPTAYMNRKAQRIREEELEEKRRRIRSLQREARTLDAASGEDASLEEVATRLEIQRLREEFNEYDTVNLYPLSVGILSRLVSSILLPLFFIVFETYVGSYL